MSIPEHYTASLNLSRMIGKKEFKVLKSDLTKALTFENEIRNMVEATLLGESLSLKSDLSTSDVNELATTISQLDTTTLLVKMTPLLTAENISIDIGMRMVEVLNGLQNFLPPDFESDSVTSLGMKFLWAARIADDPLWVINLLSNQQLTEFDVTAVSTLYPEIYEQIVSEMLTSSIEIFAKDKTIPRSIKLGLSILLQVPVLSVETLKAYQDNDDKNDKQIAPAEQPQGGSADLNIATHESEKI